MCYPCIIGSPTVYVTVDYLRLPVAPEAEKNTIVLFSFVAALLTLTLQGAGSGTYYVQTIELRVRGLVNIGPGYTMSLLILKKSHRASCFLLIITYSTKQSKSLTHFCILNFLYLLLLLFLWCILDNVDNNKFSNKKLVVKSGFSSLSFDKIET